MKPTRLYLMFAFMGVGMLGVLWAVNAQEGRPLFAPPVVPRDGVDQRKKNPPKDKAKADPTLIIPPEAFAVPRPVKNGELPSFPGVVGAVHLEEPAPAPLFPIPQAKKDEKPIVAPPPPLPAIETNPLPMPVLEPTKALIVEPKEKEAPSKKGALDQSMQPPSVLIPPPTVIPEPKKEPLIAPPTVIPEPKKEPLIAPPTVIPEPKKEPLIAPPTVIPETKQAPPTILLPSVTAPAAPEIQKPRAFVRIDSASNSAPPPVVGRPTVDVPGLEPRGPQSKLVLPPPPASTGAALAGSPSVQTPSVVVEKRGNALMRANEPQSYQLVVRNLGPTPAQQVRIEDELPANAKIVAADPMPQLQGNKAVWILPAMNVNQEQTLRLSLQVPAEAAATSRVTVQVAATSQTNLTALRPRHDQASMALQVAGPKQVALGKDVVFEVRVANQSNQPLRGIVLHGLLPEGLNTPQGRAIEGEVDVVIAPGDAKTLKMPASAVKAGRHTVAVKVTTQAGHEASTTAEIDVVAEALQVQQAPTTKLLLARDGDLRIEVTNHTGKPLRNVAVADQLPEGLDFVQASDRGLYQANRRTVYWLIDQLAAGQTQTLFVRVHGSKAGPHQNVAFAKADGVGETQSSGVVTLEGSADLTLRVVERDNLLEVGKETVYEIHVQNPGNARAHNVQLQIQFSPGLTPKNAEGKTRHTLDRQAIVFAPLAVLEAQGQAIFRVTAVAQSAGDQRVRFAIVSDQVRTPIQREVSTRVYSDRAP